MDYILNHSVISSDDAVVSTVDMVDPFNDASGIALYKLDGDVADVGGLYDATAANVTYGVGAFGQAAIFNGTSSVVTLPSGSPFADEDTIKTISGWFKFNAIDGGSLTLFSIASSTDANDYFTIIAYDNGLIYNITRVDGTSTQSSGSSSWVADTNWHHLCVMLGSSKRQVFLDGVELVNTITNAGTGTNLSWISYPTYATSIIANIGRFRVISPTYSRGNIDHVRFFNRALTPAEVVILYNEEI